MALRATNTCDLLYVQYLHPIIESRRWIVVVQAGTPQQPRWMHAVLIRKMTVLSIFGLTIAGAVIFSFLQPERYTAKTRILVRPFPSIAESAPTFNLETEAELAASDSVAELAAEDLGRGSVGLLDQFEAKPVPETEILLFTFSSTDPGSAAQGATAFAEAYIAFRRRQALDVVETARELVTERIAATQQQIERIDDQDRMADALDTERQVLVFQLAALQDRLAQLQPDVAELAKGEVITPAETPRSPTSPNLLTNVVLAAVLGTAAGVGFALARDQLT